MRLWVDDERPAPDESWLCATTSNEAKSYIYLSMSDWIEGGGAEGDRIEEVSLDHDLGGDDTGMLVLDYMTRLDFWPRALTIHTANPPARKRMLQAANAEAPADMSIYVITDHASR